MKELLCILTLCLFTRCKNTDDTELSTSPVVGVWNPLKEVHVCYTGTEKIYNYSNCQQQTTLTFFAHGGLNKSTFDVYNGDCVEISNKNGHWAIMGDRLSTTLDGDTNNYTFFELTDDILQTGDYYTGESFSGCTGNNPPSHFYIEYAKME